LSELQTEKRFPWGYQQITTRGNMGFRTVSGARLEQFAHKRLHIGVVFDRLRVWR